MDTLQEKVAIEVRALFARHRTTARQVAANLGWSEMYMSRRLNSRSPFDLNDLEAIAALLGVPIGALFGQQDDSPRVLNTVPSRTIGQGGINPSSSILPMTCVFEESEIFQSGPFLALVA